MFKIRIACNRIMGDMMTKEQAEAYYLSFSPTGNFAEIEAELKQRGAEFNEEGYLVMAIGPKEVIA